MKRISNPLNFVLRFCTLILIVSLSGCISIRPVKNSNIPLSYFENYHCVIFANTSRMYPLREIKISDGILSGKIDNKHTYKRKTIHLVLKSDSLMKIDASNILSIPVENLVLIKKSKVSFLKTGGLIYLSIAAVYVLILSIALG